MEARELADIISAFLKAQPQLQRTVFLRRYWYADDLAQIAQRYRMTQSKVKSMLFRTRNALRTHLEKEGYVL
jgi:RNA polymerase sigma-70 factor (ECF subfamily)